MGDIERVRFTLDQQIRVDKLMDEAFGRGLQKGVRQSQAEIDKLKHEIAQLKTPWWRR